MAETPFVPVGDHPSDAFINQALTKKFPDLQKAAEAQMEGIRQEGIDTASVPNPLTFMLSGLYSKFTDATGDSAMSYEDFVTKFRDKIGTAMAKHKVKPFGVAVGPLKVVEPKGAGMGMGAANILKMLVSPLWDAAVGTMRTAASPLADLPENQDPAQREAVRRGLMQPLSDAERKKGQVEVLTGLLGTAAVGGGAAEMGRGAAAIPGVGGIIKNAIEGGAWGAGFGAAHGAGQEQAAEEILNEATQGAKVGAALGGGLSIAGAGIGAGLRKYKGYKLDKLMADIDAERGSVAAHMAELKNQNPLADLLPEGGLSNGAIQASRDVRGAVSLANQYDPRPTPGLPSNTQRFTNVNLPDGVRELLDADKVTYLNRADAILRQKGITLDYMTGEMKAIPKEGTGIAPPQIPESTTLRRSSIAPVNELPGGVSTIHLPAGMAQDAEKEMGYRLTYGDRIFGEKSAEYDILPPEVKAKIDFWTYLDKTEGTQGAQFMRNLEKSARSRMAVRASKRLSTAMDITHVPGEGAREFADAAVIGAAKLYRLGHLAPEAAFKVWNNEMAQVIGNSAAAKAQMFKLYQASQKQLVNMLQLISPEMHDVRNLMEKFQQGKAGMDWYTNGYAELEKMYGPEDAKLMAHLLSIHSTGTVVDQNVRGALADFARIKAGLPVKGGRFPNNQVPMIEKMLRGEPYGDQKVQNFTHLLLGGTGHAVNDVQVARAIGWARESFSKNQYRFVDHVIQGLAKDAGVTPEQYQAALWTTPRIEKAQEANAAGSKKLMQYVGSFRPYSEAIRVENVKTGIDNALKVPGDEGGGGYTFNTKNMHAWQGKGYLTTLTGDVVPESGLTIGSILKFRDRVMPLLKEYKKAKVEFTIGLWKKGDGTVSIDLNMVTPSKEQALAIGQRTDQFAIGDMTTGRYEGDIPTGKAPESAQRQIRLPEVRKILKDLIK
jgi:hypothetical protein